MPNKLAVAPAIRVTPRNAAPGVSRNIVYHAPGSAAGAQSAPPLEARDASGNIYGYTVLSDKTARIESFACACEHVVVPEFLDGHEVAEVAQRAFSYSQGLRTLVLPESVTSVGDYAFECCSTLEEVVFGEHLEHIGSYVMSMCASVKELCVPGSVRTLGIRPFGETGLAWSTVKASVVIHPDNPHLFMDASGIVYRRCADGLHVSDASMCTAARVSLDPRTVEVQDNAFLGVSDLVCAELPEGLKRIGESAFRGCTHLTQVVLPSTLERIDDAAFSCSAIRSIRIPAACTQLAQHALNTGPVVEGREDASYRSTIEHISIDPENPVYCMHGDVVCRRLGPAGLEAIACSSHVDEVVLDQRIARVAPAAFAGTVHIEHLSVRSGLDCPAGGLLGRASVGCITLLDEHDSHVASLEMPGGSAGTDLIAASFCGGKVDASFFLQNYDLALAGMDAGLDKARCMLDRITSPHTVPAALLDACKAELAQVLDSVCIHFGLRSYWRGFDQLATAGVLTQDNIVQAIGTLTQMGDAAASGYLLDLKRRCFGKAMWDYAL